MDVSMGGAWVGKGGRVWRLGKQGKERGTEERRDNVPAAGQEVWRTGAGKGKKERQGEGSGVGRSLYWQEEGLGRCVRAESVPSGMSPGDLAQETLDPHPMS